jgi:hypothetical protein
MQALEAAKKQSFFREVNERMRRLNESVEQGDSGADFLCECAGEDCTYPIQISLEAYDELRRVPTRFAVAAGMDHVFPEIERIFARCDGYFVVEMFGEAGLASIKLDPRTRVGGVRLPEPATLGHDGREHRGGPARDAVREVRRDR